MKNRDNEFFREEELDELVEKRDYETLRDKMSRIFACPCCLNGFKHCRKYLEVFSKSLFTFVCLLYQQYNYTFHELRMQLENQIVQIQIQ